MTAKQEKLIKKIAENISIYIKELDSGSWTSINFYQRRFFGVNRKQFEFLLTEAWENNKGDFLTEEEDNQVFRLGSVIFK